MLSYLQILYRLLPILPTLLILPCTVSAQGARYLIITHDDYYEALIPLAEWKTQKGLKAKIVKLSEIGSDSAQIKSYVTSAYDNWQIRPEFLLLVGNDNQIPFCRMPGALLINSDNYYTDVAGDFHNEIIPGRFWVYDTLHVKTIVAKILGYEKTPLLSDPFWFRKGATIVNEDVTGIPGDSVYWYDARFTHALMMNAGFTQIDSFARSLGHTSTDVVNAINDGRTYILYRGEGFAHWSWPFDQIYPDLMYNGFKLPVVISATCATVEGIGHDWLNAGLPSQPKGVVGFFGTTSALYLAAEMRSALAQGTMQSIFCDSFVTLGKAAEAGRLNYYALFGNLIEYHSWTCLGDPELNLWTSTPRPLDVFHNSQLLAGVCTLLVEVKHNAVPVESALVGVIALNDTTYFGWKRTDDNGQAVIIDSIPIPGDTVLVTVTGRNLLPYVDSVIVTVAGGPYVLLHSFSINDSSGGNGDSVANPGENIEIPVWLKNWGDSTAYDVTAVARKTGVDPFFDLQDTIKTFGNLAPMDSAFTSIDGYNIIIASNCPDGHNINVQLLVSDSFGVTWINEFELTVRAPVLIMRDYSFPPHSISTPPGDTNALTIELQNIGSYQAVNAVGKIFTSDTLFHIVDSLSDFGTIQQDSGIANNQSNPFVITSDPQTPICHPVEIGIELTSGVYVDTCYFTVYVGKKDFFLWDADPNQSSGPTIKSILDSLEYFGEYGAAFPHGLLSLYRSLLVCAGVYPDKHVITDTSLAAFEIADYISSQTGCVYLEGGDVWYDPVGSYGYDFGPLFGIDCQYNSIGTFQGVGGVNGTFTQNMEFQYTGEATLIDYIDSTGGSQIIFKKINSNYGCGVAANDRTIGLSFELAGLVDSLAPSTRLALVDSVMDYFAIPPTGITEAQEFTITPKITLTCHPNPFKQIIDIRYEITDAGYQGIRGSAGRASEYQQPELSIYDVTGRSVRNLSDQLSVIGCPSSVRWDGRDDSGRKLAQGIYFIHLQSKGLKKVVKTILLH